jgi:hypothetical protein
VKIAMKRHAFHFGTEVNLDAWHGAAESGRRFSEADSRNYRTRSMAYFNRVNLDQAFHWKIWEAAKAGRAPGFTAERIAEVLRFYEERRVRVAAGPLFVAGDVFVPDEFRAAYAHPRVEGVDFAGFWAGAHPFPNSALWSSDWQTTPAGDAYLDLVYKQWWTQAEGYTDAEGTFSVQGFTGSYEITVGSALVNESRQVDLGTDGLSLEFKP